MDGRDRVFLTRLWESPRQIKRRVVDSQIAVAVRIPLTEAAMSFVWRNNAFSGA